MKFFGRAVWYTNFDHKRTEEIFEDLKVKPVDKKKKKEGTNQIGCDM
jgi:hypothetical protein